MICVFVYPHLTRHNNIIVVVLSCKLTTDGGCTTFGSFRVLFCATQHYGTVELVVDAIIFPYF